MSNKGLYNFPLLTLLFLFSFKNIICQTEKDFSISKCNDNNDLLFNEYCFNNFSTFENYQINHLAKNNDGDLVVELTKYTQNNEISKKFYELTKDGQSFFSDESSSTKQFDIIIDEDTYNENLHFSLDGSKNLFVYIYNNRLNQYLFSINAYNSMVELYDVNNNNNKYYIWSFNKFFNLDLDRYYSPCSYELFELKQGLSYIIAFIPKETVNEGMKTYIFIKKFRFKSFDKNAYDELGSVTFQNFVNKKILNVFLMDNNGENNDENTFAVLTYDENSRRRISKIVPPGDWLLLRKTETNYVFNMKFYKNTITESNDVEISGFLTAYYHGEKLFIKSLYLNDGLFVFLYYKEDGYFYVELYELINEDSKMLSKQVERSYINT